MTIFLLPDELLKGDVQVDEVANDFNLLDVLPFDSVLSISAILCWFEIEFGKVVCSEEVRLTSQQLWEIKHKGVRQNQVGSALGTRKYRSVDHV